MDSAEDCGSYGTVRGFHVNTAFRAVTTPNAGGAGRPAPPVIHRVTIIVVEWIMKTRNESLNYARKVLESVNAGDLSQAAAYADKMMACQELGEDVPFAGGYFYTDESKTELSLFQCQGQDDPAGTVPRHGQTLQRAAQQRGSQALLHTGRRGVQTSERCC